METYENALATGAEYVEFDIRRLADGTLVCFHDGRVGHTGPPLATLSYERFCGLVGFAVPTVPDVMALLAGRARAHLDLKEIGYEAEVVRLAVAALGADGFVATTLEDESIAAIAREFPNVRTALSLGRDNREIPRRKLPAVRISELLPLRRARACGAHWVAVNYRIAGPVLRQCARHGVGAMVWTVDEDRLIDRYLRDDRVDVLITNRPGYALHRRASLAAPRSEDAAE